MSGYQRYPNVGKVSVALNLEEAAIPLGTLAWSGRENRAYFEYDKDFVARGLPVSPFKLPLRTGAVPAPAAPFGGLHGLFNDSLPDGWGRWLLDRRLQRRNYNKDELTALDRLTFVGARGMGALAYEHNKIFDDPKAGDVDLDLLSEQVEKFQTEFDDGDVDRLYDIQGSSGGARPKVMIGRHPRTGRMIADVGKILPEGFEPWLVKFRSTANDHAEIGAEEYAYSLMAQACGIEMAETKLLKGRKGRHFAARRFDRTSTGRLHIQSASGLLEIDHNIPQIDYDTLLKLVGVLTRDRGHVRQMFRRMVFNVLAHNRDDHSKNHAFEMGIDGAWKPTPAYDLTLSAGPGGQHALAVSGEGRNPGHKHILEVAVRASIAKADAETIFEEVRAAVEKWPSHAERAEVSDRRMAEVDYLLNRRGRQPKEEIEVATQPPSP